MPNNFVCPVIYWFMERGELSLPLNCWSWVSGLELVACIVGFNSSLSVLWLRLNSWAVSDCQEDLVVEYVTGLRTSVTPIHPQWLWRLLMVKMQQFAPLFAVERTQKLDVPKFRSKLWRPSHSRNDQSVKLNVRYGLWYDAKKTNPSLQWSHRKHEHLLRIS